MSEGQVDLDVSVVIPAYNGAATIADSLESVLAATAGRRREIIVVESSGDRTAEIVRARFPDVRVIQSATRLTAGGARNRGASEARGRLVFFVDQDCLVPRDWVEQLSAHLTDPAIGAAGGAVGIRNLSNLSGCAVYFLEFLYHFPSRRPATRDQNFLVGCNCVLRAETLRAARFPDQTLGEDILFTHAVRRAGFSVMYDPQVEVKHQNRAGWGEFFNYNRKMGRASASYHDVLQLWWIKPFFEAPLLAFMAPAAILPSIGFDLIRSRPAYFLRFLLLLPMCLAGNLVWAKAFRDQVLEIRAQAQANKAS